MEHRNRNPSGNHNHHHETYHRIARCPHRYRLHRTGISQVRVLPTMQVQVLRWIGQVQPY